MTRPSVTYGAWLCQMWWLCQVAGVPGEEDVSIFLPKPGSDFESAQFSLTNQHMFNLHFQSTRCIPYLFDVIAR